MIFHADGQTFPKFSKYVLQYLQKQVRNEVDFLHVDKHQSFLQVYFNTLGVKFSYEVNTNFIDGHDQAF